LGDANPQSLDDYVSRMPPEQTAIYYLNAPSRAYALASPYYESFAKKKIEVCPASRASRRFG
jgi:HSP90 family molecular chaperone